MFLSSLRRWFIARFRRPEPFSPAPFAETSARSPDARQQAARLTAEKIDRIEAEMAVPIPAPPPSAKSEPALHPAMEQAALTYARGDPATAIEVLYQAIAQPGTPVLPQAAWLVLFDLYQLGGDRRAFESLAIDYVARFESSPPAWTDAPQPQARLASVRGSAGSRVETLAAGIDGAEALRVWQILAQSTADSPVVIDCSAVISVDEAGAGGLLAVLRDARSSANDQPVSLTGVEALLTAARHAMDGLPAGASEPAWMLAFFVLRLLDRQAEFEDLAVRYCMIFEVSPPSWEPPAASVRIESPPLIVSGAAQAAPVDRPAGTGLSARAAQRLTLPLTGDADERTGSDLRALSAVLPVRGTELVIDCRALRRLDEPALAELRARIAQFHASGVKVSLIEPNRVVQALMQKAGLHRIARLRERKI